MYMYVHVHRYVRGEVGVGYWLVSQSSDSVQSKKKMCSELVSGPAQILRSLPNFCAVQLLQ